MGLREDVEQYINCPWSDGYTSAKIISQYGEKAFDQEMKRVNGWNRHRSIVDGWAHKGRGGHGRY